MNGLEKARKAQIVYNGIELEAYQLPNGEYNLSKNQVGGSIGKSHKSLGEFLEGKSPEALPYKDFSPGEISIEGNNAIFHGVPLDLAAAYWTYWAQRGNTTALALVSTSVVESLTRLCNNAFGIENNEVAIQQMNVENVDTNKMLFKMIGMMEGFQTELREAKKDLNQAMEEMRQTNEEKKVLEEFKDDVENYVEFSRLLNIAKNDVDEDEFPDGISCRDYVTLKSLPLHAEAFCTLSRRTASYYRSTKGVNPPKRYNLNVYSGKDVAYIITTIQMLMRGL